MKRLLILKDVTYSAKIGGGTIAGYNEVNQLANGAVAVFTEDGRMLTAAGAAATFAAQPNVKKVYIAVGSGDANTGARISSYIDRDTINVVKQAYVAPVTEIQFVGEDSGGTGDLNLPAPLVVGDSAIIRTIDTSFGTHPPIYKKTYEYVVKTGDTAAEILAGLVALITANPDSPVTASVVGANVGLQFATIAVDKHIEIVCDGILRNATIETGGAGASTAIVYSNGTPAKVSALETETSAVEGNTNRVYMPQMWYSRPTDVDLTTTYALWTLDWDNVKHKAVSVTHSTHELLFIALANEGAGGVATELTTIFTQAFGTARVNVETGA